MDLKSDFPFWPLKNGLLATYPALKQDIPCEVAILGGGITGALVAYFLTEAGVDVAMLDKRDFGQGSTSASTSLLQYEIDTHLHELIPLVGEAHAVRAYRLCLEAIFKLEAIVATLGDPCGFERRKSVYLASRKRDVAVLQRELDARQAAGFRVEFWTQGDVEAHLSFSRPAALLSQDGAQVDAYRLTHRLLERASERGLRAFDRTEVTRIEPMGDGIVLTTDRGCRVVARRVVFATGYESQEYLKEKVTTLHSTFALASEPLAHFPGWFERSLLWESARPYTYLRTTSDDRAIVGGEDEPFRDPRRRDALLPRKVARLEKRFREMFPAIDMDVAFCWAGTFGETKDGLAYIGASPEWPNALFALGYGGNGITFSVVAAEILRDLLLERDNPDAQIFRFGR